jgi:hypothetical protein
MLETTKQDTPICFMQVNMGNTSQTLATLPDCDKNKNML